jgi:hypothetical protein
VHNITGLEFPPQIACRRVERVKISVAASEIDNAIRDDRTREEHIKRVRDRLVFRLPSMYTFRLKPALAFGCKLPF